MKQSSKGKKGKASKNTNLRLTYNGPEGRFYTIQRNSGCNPAINKLVRRLILDNKYNSVRIEGSGGFKESYFPSANLVFTDPPILSGTSPDQFIKTLIDILTEAYQFGSYINCRKINNVELCLTSSIQFKSAVEDKQFTVQITDMKTKLYEKLKSVANR